LKWTAPAALPETTREILANRDHIRSAVKRLREEEGR
jgi:hypothetical protein